MSGGNGVDGRQSPNGDRRYATATPSASASVSRILVVYASIHGQSARIAERLASRLRGAGHRVTLRAANAIELLWEIERHDAVLVGGSIRFGRHAPQLEALVRDRRADLESRPSAFFSVCLSAGGPGARPAAAQRYRDRFFERTGWQPNLSTSFGGACRYTRYNFAIRTIIRLIMTITGGDTDTSRDYEYTDWAAVDAFADRFAAPLAAAVPRRAAAQPALAR